MSCPCRRWDEGDFDEREDRRNRNNEENDVSDLRGILHSDMNCISDRDLCRLFRKLSCKFCRR